LVVTAPEALRDIRGYALAGRIEVTSHALRRMRERGVLWGDLRHALADATACNSEPGDRWRVKGTDLEGDVLTVVVALENRVVVVTLF
jgi:pentatricopeptide repeat protein